MSGMSGGVWWGRVGECGGDEGVWWGWVRECGGDG